MTVHLPSPLEYLLQFVGADPGERRYHKFQRPYLLEAIARLELVADDTLQTNEDQELVVSMIGRMLKTIIAAPTGYIPPDRDLLTDEERILLYRLAFLDDGIELEEKETEAFGRLAENVQGLNILWRGEPEKDMEKMLSILPRLGRELSMALPELSDVPAGQRVLPLVSEITFRLHRLTLDADPLNVDTVRRILSDPDLPRPFRWIDAATPHSGDHSDPGIS